jgi:hypothetical protein
LHAFNQNFAAHYQRTDLEFVALAKSLRNLYAIAQSLAGVVSERLGSVRTALHESRIAGPEGVAAASLQDLRQGLADVAAELTLLQAVGGQLQKLRSLVGKIERVGLSIRTSVFGFAVESVRTDECRQAFSSFAAELRALGERFTHVAGTIGSHVGATHAAQANEWRALSASHSQLYQLVEQLKTAASATADEAQKMLDHVVQGLHQAGECMHQITHHAEEAVFYLQFGDIIRQKTEHIAETLREIAGQLDPAAARSEFRARATTADRVIAIQVGQLELVRTEVASAQRKLAESFQALAEEATRMRGTLGRWQANQSDSPKASDSLSAFKSDLLRMEVLHRQGDELRLAARRSTRSAIEATHQLAGHISEVKTLNSDMHLQALNAIAKTAALGEQGATLSVLSMHVDSLYCDSQSVVADIVAILESVLGQTGAPADSQELTETTIRSGRLHAGMTKIESACNECVTTFTSANPLIEQQQAALEAARSLLEFLAGQGSAIQQQIEELNTFRAMLAPWITGQGSSASASGMLNGRYTMQSERDIHENAMKVAGINPAAPNQQEIFEATPAGGGVPALLRPELKNENAGRQTTLVASTSPPPGTDLGDNVELF